MELYFNRHRAGKVETSPSWIDYPWDCNPMWTQSHDGDLKFQTSQKVIHLHRNPVDVIYSLVKLTNKHDIENKARAWKQHYEKWTNYNTTPCLQLKYEKILKKPHLEMERISNFFNKPFDMEKSKHAFETVGSKKQTNEKNGKNARFKNPESHTVEYDQHRVEFRNKWGDRIYTITGYV
jgi:hypothetical protein